MARPRPMVVTAWVLGLYFVFHLYGGPAATASPGIALGNLAFRGERGVLRLSGDDLLRLRWNPFFDYLQSRTLQFMRLDRQ